VRGSVLRSWVRRPGSDDYETVSMQVSLVLLCDLRGVLGTAGGVQVSMRIEGDRRGLIRIEGDRKGPVRIE